MSSFKRKATSKVPPLPGTRPSPASISSIITSTGIPSLDDILGGGLPLSCSLVVAAPDLHSSYGELLQKYFVSQGLVCKQDLLIIGDKSLQEWVNGCMWLHGPSSASSFNDGVHSANSARLDEGDDTSQEDLKIKIAWRYESMKQFQTTVGLGPSTPSSDEYCHTFDLTTRIPGSVIEEARRTDQLNICDVTDMSAFSEGSSPKSQSVVSRLISWLEHVLSQRSSNASSTPLRICIPSLGSPAWGDLTAEDILLFMHTLRSLLRSYPTTCASIALSPPISTASWGGPGWLQKLGWMCDGLITLDAFTGNPSLSTLFSTHHGLLHIHTLPAPHTLLAPSDRFSALRGLAASAAESGSSGENNLAFKCTRKRLIFETLHLDVEGGTGERRTTPSANSTSFNYEPSHSAGGDRQISKTASASIEVEFDAGDMHEDSTSVAITSLPGVARIDTTNAVMSKSKPRKAKKTVAFQSDRPDLYDF